VTAIAIYGRTYLDAELEVPIDQLATGKGKVDVEVRPILGGFPCNAARALAGRLPADEIAIATRIPAIDLPRLRAAVPAGTQIHAVADDTLDWPPITVIVNPASDCRLLRSGRAGDLVAADLGELPSASVHVFGRVDASLVGDVWRAAPDAVLAWCAGASAPLSVIDACDIVCVNTAEAIALTGIEGTTRDLATRLAEHASPRAGSTGSSAMTGSSMSAVIRVVTGRGSAPTVAAVRTGSGLQLFESAPPPIPRDQVRRLLRVGDVFAARFVVEATLDDRGQRRAAVDIQRALVAAQAAAGEFMVRP
jgi:hypothetical protein